MLTKAATWVSPYFYGVPFSTVLPHPLPSNLPTLGGREGRLEERGVLLVLNYFLLTRGIEFLGGKSSLHCQDIFNLFFSLLCSQPLDELQIQESAAPGTAGRPAATTDPFMALPSIFSPQSPELNYLRLAKITPLLVHEANHNHPP